MSANFPIAKEKYDRNEEQVFRELARQGINKASVAAQVISEKWRFANLPTYADDAAAGAGGLIQGSFYKTATGALMVKL